MSEQEGYLDSILPDQATNLSKTNISKIMRALFSMDFEVFHCEQTGTPGMTVDVYGGRFYEGGTYKEFSLDGNLDVTTTASGTFSAPSVNPKIDLLYYDTATNALAITAGAEGASPVAPTIPDPAKKIPVALIYHRVGSTSIKDTDDSTNSYIMGRNIRPFLNIPGRRIELVQARVIEFTTDITTGDGKDYIHIPTEMDGMNLVGLHAEVITAGTTGTTDIQVHNVTQAADMLTTKLTIDSTETGSDTAATAAVIDTANDDVAENDVLRIDVDAVSTTAPKGLIVTLKFKLP
jgi:hypothetical protein